MKITIKLKEHLGKRGRWKAIKVSKNTREMIKSFETRRLRTCSWRWQGDNSRAREKKRKPICSSRLWRSCFTLSRPYVACRTLISNWIDRCFGQHLWTSVHSLSRDNPRIRTNPLSGIQQPSLLWGQWIRTKSCSKLQPCLIQTEVTFQLHRTWRVFCWRYNSVPLIWRLSVTPYTTCLFVTHIYMGFFVRIYKRVCKKMVIYLGVKRKYTWQKNARISCSRNDCKYTWEKTARISCHNFETNGRP